MYIHTLYTRLDLVLFLGPPRSAHVFIQVTFEPVALNSRRLYHVSNIEGREKVEVT